MLDELRTDLDTLKLEFASHAAETRANMRDLIQAQKEDSLCISNMHKAIVKQQESTAELVDSFRMAKAVIRFASILGSIGKWVTSIAVLGAAIQWLIKNWH